jgi:hypothetical protein
MGYLYHRRWGGPNGRGLISVDGGYGNPYRLQPNLFANNFFLVKPNTGSTAPVPIGGDRTTGGTITHPALATTNFLTKMRRTRFANVVTTQNQFLGMRGNDLHVFRGAALGEGGFFFFARFGFPLFPAGTRVFVGLASLLTGVHVTADPSVAAAHHIGLAMDLADTNLTIMSRNGTTNTKTVIGAGLPRTVNDVYDLVLFARQGATDIGVRLDRYLAATGVLTNLFDAPVSTNIPTTTTFLAPLVAMSNGTANTGAASVGIEIASLYLESDF